MAAELLRTGLPAPWNFGVLQDGRVFFINENSKHTTWLHPVHNHPIQSGFISVNDLPRGWELAFTPESVPYYVDHINSQTSFIHPVTGESELPVHDGTLQRNDQNSSGTNQKQNFKRASVRRKSAKQKLIDKPPALQRSVDAPVTIKGWLYKQEGGGLKSWKKRWFVLSDFCLYYYKGSEEGQTVGALLLPSYKIDYCTREDGVNKKYAFKAEHQNMRTCYFATDTVDDQTRWIKALTLAAVVQTDPDTDFNRNRSSEGLDQTQAKVPLNYSQSSDQDFSHPKASNTGGFNESRFRDYSPNLRQSGNDQLPQDRTYSTNLESTRISDRGSGTNLSQQDTGGFGEPRLSPRDRLSAFGPPNSDNFARPDQQPGGFADTNNPTSSNEPSRLTEENMAMLGRQMSNRNSYDPGPRARSSFDPNPHYQPNTRNSYGSQDPRYQEPQRLDRGRPGSAGAYRQDPSPRDSRGHPRDSRSEPRTAPGQRNSDLESISSRGSQRMHPRDQNYNVPKASTSGNYSLAGQPYGGNPANGYSVNNTFEQSGDSMENTLDRSFDSSQQLPGYDSFRKERPDPALFRRSDSNTGSLHRNPNEVHKSDSLRHLQEWTKSQASKPRSRPSSSYSNASDRPLSDGRRIYSSSNPPSERSSVKGLPSPQDTHPGQSHRSPPPDRLNLNVASAQTYSQSHGGPSAVSTSEVQESHPDRPPIPAAFREQYIQELAETKTPHTRNDLLSSIPIQRLRQHEPLVFQYPEDRERQLVKQSKAEPVPQSRPQPQAQIQRADGSRVSLTTDRNEPMRFHPTKSWDDLNDLDTEIAEERFKYNSRIDLLLEEKRRIEGQTQAKGQPNQQRSTDQFPIDSRDYMALYMQKYGRNDGQIHENPRTGSFRFVQSPEKPVRRGLEEDLVPRREDQDLHGHGQQHSSVREHLAGNRANEQSWLDLNHGDDGRYFDPYHDGNPGYGAGESQHDYVSQSERDVRRPAVNGYDPSGGQDHGIVQNGYHHDNQRLTQSLGNLHVDVGGWPENTLAKTPHEPGNQASFKGPSAARPFEPQQFHHSQGPSRPVGSPRPQREHFSTPQRNIETIKEDPAMSDHDTLTTKTLADLQQHLSGHRMRLSIAAGDLGDKSHEELVLLLIQLRRDQSKLEHSRDFYRSKLDVGRPNEKDYKIKRKSSIGRLNEVVENEHDIYVEIRKMYDELENQLEVTKPLVSLLDNMVRMGSLYGGNNLMLASQYKRHKLAPGEYTAPKKMILFSRQYQEEKLTKEQEEELRQLEADEVDLEEKLQQLYKLDRDLQERSLAVTTLQTNKDRLEKNVNQLRKDIQMTEDPRQAQRLKQQLRPLEGELAVLRQQLSESSKVLEDISRQDSKVENEVMLLRKKIYGINRSQHSPTLPGPGANVRARQKLEEELDGIRSIMDTMSKEQGNLSHQITSLRHSTPDLLAADSAEKSGTSYMQTDLDSGQSQDLSKDRKSGFSRYDNSHYSSVRGTRSEATNRDRSKSAPPPLEREILPQQEQKVVTAHVRRDQFTPIPREASIASSQSVQWSQSHGQRDSTRQSTGSQYASIPRSQPASQPQGSTTSQTTYNRQAMNREVQNGSLDLHGPVPSSSRSSLSRDDHRPPSREGYRPGVQTGDERPASRNSGTGLQPRDGLYRAQIRMVTPEPTEQNRYRGEAAQSSASSSTSSHRERSLTASQQGYGHQYGSQDRVHSHGQRSGSHEQIYGSKPMSEVRPQQQYNVHRVEQHSVSVNKQGPVQGTHFQDPGQMYNPIELSEADDNTKKFFGLVPKDAARTQTVRDVKKKESERRSRERKRFYVNVHGPADLEEAAANDEPQDFQRTQSLPRRLSAPVYSDSEQHTHDDSVLKRRSVGVVKAKKAQQVENRQSAAARLFGGGLPSPSPSPVPSYQPQTAVSTRTTTTARQPWHSAGSDRNHSQPRPTSVATVRPVPTNRAPRANSADFSVTKSLHITTNGHSFAPSQSHTGGLDHIDQRALDEEERKVRQYWADRLKSRHVPRGRFMTISSTQPVKMESPQKVSWKPAKVHSAAGEIISGRWRDDLHEVVHSQPFKDFQFDDTTIDREVLFVPEKVEIPERYIHESETEESEEQKMRRFEKATQIKRMLAAQSMAETGVDNHGYYKTPRHTNPNLEAELHRREKLLDLKQELAYQVTQKSKEVAGNKPEHALAEPGRDVQKSGDGSMYKPTPAFTSRVTIGSLSPPPTPTGGIMRRRIRTLSQDGT